MVYLLKQLFKTINSYEAAIVQCKHSFFFVHDTIIFTVGFTLFFHALAFLSDHSFQKKWK